MAYHKIKPLPYIPFYLLLLPALIVGGHIVQTTYSDNFYYGPFVGSFLYVALDPVSIAIYALMAFIITKLLHYARTFRKPLKITAYVILAIVLPVATLVMIGMTIFLPTRYDMSDEYCQSPLIKELKRCEGVNKSIMQGRLSIIARYGQAVPDIARIISSYPSYDLHQLPCEELVGNMGQQCFIGQDLRDTSDIDYFAAYITGDRILILETENISLLVSDQEVEQFHYRVRDHMDISRFQKDMKAK